MRLSAVIWALACTSLLGCQPASVVQCRSNQDCPEGGLCQNNACWLPCNADVDCMPVEACNAGFCTPVMITTCREHDDCVAPGICEHGDGARCVAGACTYEPKLINSPCDDDDPCTAGDLCDIERRCLGLPVVCNQPPPSECLANDTLFRTYASPGSCDPTNGDCIYDPNDESCPTCITSCLHCDDHTDCAPAGYCDNDDICTQRAADGGACTGIGNEACVSRYCDGTLCCNHGDCCNIAIDCPSGYDGTPVCTDTGPDTDCQGTRLRGICNGNVCDADVVDDDSGCQGVEFSCPNHFGPVTCTDDIVQDPPACANTCDDNDDCVTGYPCDGTACIPPVGLGDSCTGTGQGTCESGLKCENGVCCASSGPTCCSTAAQCSAGLTCDQGAFACHTSCNNYDDTLCAQPDAYCLTNSCQPKLDDGTACVNRGQCVSDYCTGFCCSSGDCCGISEDCPGGYVLPSSCNIVGPSTECQGERSEPTCTSSQCGSTLVDDDSGCTGEAHECANFFAPIVCSADGDQPVATCLSACTGNDDCVDPYVCVAPDCMTPTPSLIPGDTTLEVEHGGFTARCLAWNGDICTHPQIRPPAGDGPDTCAAFVGTSADWYDVAYCSTFFEPIGENAMWFCYFATGNIASLNRSDSGEPIPGLLSFTHRFGETYSCIADNRTAWDSGIRGVHPNSDWVQVGFCNETNRLALECEGW